MKSNGPSEPRADLATFGGATDERDDIAGAAALVAVAGTARPWLAAGTSVLGVAGRAVEGIGWTDGDALASGSVGLTSRAAWATGIACMGVGAMRTLAGGVACSGAFATLVARARCAEKK